LYHIVTNNKKTFLTKIINNRYVTIDTVCDKGIRTNNPEVFKKADGHLIVFFKNKEVKGVLEIFGNEIIVRRKR
jgi:hypothetical protein